MGDGTSPLKRNANACQVRRLLKSWGQVRRLLELIGVLSTSYDIASDCLLTPVKDRASVTIIAMRTLQIVYPHVLDIGCFSQTIAWLCWWTFTTHILAEFSSNLVKLFSHSPKARLLWKEQTGRPMTSYSPTLWWRKQEVINQLLVQFGDNGQYMYLTSNQDVGAATCTSVKVLAVFSTPQQKGQLLAGRAGCHALLM